MSQEDSDTLYPWEEELPAIEDILATIALSPVEKRVADVQTWLEMLDGSVEPDGYNIIGVGDYPTVILTQKGSDYFKAQLRQRIVVPGYTWTDAGLAELPQPGVQ